MGNDNHSMTYPIGNTAQRYALAQKDGANRFSRVIKQASTGRARPPVKGQSVDQFRVASPPPPTTWRSWRTVDARECCQSGLGFQLISIQMKDKLWRRVCEEPPSSSKNVSCFPRVTAATEPGMQLRIPEFRKCVYAVIWCAQT